ncbi:calcium-binding protein [Parvularcula sp. ZS-1/3]|uniref:Calcium-binding protein n=1 Tax=Parvularcula mediterranea TaxID=2732508 RepID=A0A7Y3RJW6_9PROT|nr:calcium-binding protein [Parvularcula mediterranea]NNU15340.1 calcium-binding protein [Parvularcula mediterranea]
MLLGSAISNNASFSTEHDQTSYEVFADHPFLCHCHGCSLDQEEIDSFEPAWGDSVSSGPFGAVMTGVSELASDIVNGPGNFNYTIDVIDAVGSLGSSTLQAFTEVVDLAMKTWAYFLGGNQAGTLDISVTVGGTDAVASAGPGGLYFGEYIDTDNNGFINDGDFRVVLPGSLIELQTGQDLNGGAADIVVFVNETLLQNDSFYFGTDLTESVPSGKIDFYSVMLHEIGHGLGFIGLNDAVGVYETSNFTIDGQTVNLNYGTYLDYYTRFDSEGIARYYGPNAAEGYGDGVPIEFTTGSSGSDLSHLLGRAIDGFDSDLRHSLMNPFTVNGDRVAVGILELLMLQDFGHTIANNGTIFTNTLDGRNLPVVSVTDSVRVSGTTIEFDIVLSQQFGNGAAAASVGYEVLGTNGRVTGRAVFDLETSATIALDGEALFGAGLSGFEGGLSIRLFNPANLTLPNELLTQDFPIGEDVPAPAPPPPPPPAPEPEAPLPEATYEEAPVISTENPIRGIYLDERIVGTQGSDFLDGGSGDDRLVGKRGDDILVGSGGDDRTVSINGRNIMIGDLFQGFDLGGRDEFDLGTEQDWIFEFETGQWGDAGVDLLSTAQTFSGFNKASEVFSMLDRGISTLDELKQLADILATDNSAATYAELVGSSLSYHFGNGRAIHIMHVDAAGQDLADVFADYRAEVTAEVSDGLIEINGTRYTDVLFGGAANEHLIGGGKGDLLVGGAGHDAYTGKNGPDSFVVGNGADTITDFTFAGRDVLIVQFDWSSVVSSGWEQTLRSFTENGIRSADDLLAFIDVLNRDGTTNTRVTRSDNDLFLSFERDDAGRIIHGVRLEGLIGQDGLTLEDIFGTTNVGNKFSDAQVFAEFDDVLVA